MSDSKPAILGGTPIRSAGEPVWPIREPAIDAVFSELAASGAWGMYEGPYCDRLEAELATRHQLQHVRLTASGTAAVEYALRGVGVGQGDEVVMAAWDFKANFVDVVALGATPVLVDVRADNGQLDVGLVADAFGTKTKAVIASHLHGCVVDMPALRELCDAHSVALVEDVCQMPLADVYGRPAGTWGDVGVLSFGGSKTLSAGRGGAIVADNATIAQRLQVHDWRGNRLSPLSEMQAAVLLPQLELFDARHARRFEAAAWLRKRFDSFEGLTPLPASVGRPDYYKFPFWYDAAAMGGLSRETFCDAMHAEGVTLSPSFPALHLTHSPKRFRHVGQLNNAEQAGKSVVVLHHPVMLLGEDEWEMVYTAAERIQRFAGELVKRDSA